MKLRVPLLGLLMLLTGKHSGHAFIRGNDEWNDRGEVWNYRAVLEDSTLGG